MRRPPLLSLLWIPFVALMWVSAGPEGAVREGLLTVFRPLGLGHRYRLFGRVFPERRVQVQMHTSEGVISPLPPLAPVPLTESLPRENYLLHQFFRRPGGAQREAYLNRWCRGRGFGDGARVELHYSVEWAPRRRRDEPATKRVFPHSCKVSS